jgi:hypothetical protein
MLTLEVAIVGDGNGLPSVSRSPRLFGGHVIAARDFASYRPIQSGWGFLQHRAAHVSKLAEAARLRPLPRGQCVC